jgi:predicted nucleic acid-binding protein
MTTNYLLDTNAISEISKNEPDSSFLEWFNGMDGAALFTSCLVIGELNKGIELLPDSEKRRRFENILTELLDSFSGQIIGIDTEICLSWGQLFARGRLSGLTPPDIDTLIAAQCIEHDMMLITRNTRDFEQFHELKVHSPWSK